MLQTVLSRIDRVSDEFHRDLGQMRVDLSTTEDRVMAAIETSRHEFIEYSKSHATDHAVRRADVEGRLATFTEFMRTRELRQARDDGALGMLRFVLDTLGRNWQLIGLLLAALLLALGNVQLDIGIR